MSGTVSNNNPREDSIFQTKVKGALLQDAGTGGLVQALIQFRTRHADAVQEGRPGLTHEAFTRYLRDCGAQLSPFEEKYLCAAFNNEAHVGFIDETTFVRHLCGMNQRRMHAVQQLWDRLDKDAEGCVSVEALTATHRAAAAEAAVPANTAGFEETFHAPNDHLSSTRGTTARGTSSGTVTVGDSTDDMRRASFETVLAFYAGLSQSIARDESFVVHVLREWASDAPSHPKLNETNREWGADGDPLASNGPLYVRDALNHQLGVSSKSYNTAHMQRVHPPCEPLPPLNRNEIMKTTAQERMPAYNQEQRDTADPLVTRRGQLS